MFDSLSLGDVAARLGEARKTVMALFVGALTLLFTQTLTSYLQVKLKDLNVWGVDFTVFELGFIGAVIIVLSYFGLVKNPAK